MRVMYIAPRYHTNQVNIMKGFMENGHEVCFLSHYRGEIEDYTYIKPIVVGYSPFFNLFYNIYTRLLFKKSSTAADIKLKLGFPPICKLYRYINQFNPDVVILRERSIYSIMAFLICKLKGLPSILYNQSPLWEKEIKDDFAHKVVKKLSPDKRITPVYGDPLINKVKEDGVIFVPFVMEPKVSPDDKKYCENNIIHIFSIGKYEDRKNHFLLLDIFNVLNKKYNTKLVIAGECSTEFHKSYYEKLELYIKKHNLSRKIVLLKNLTRQQVEEEYKKADIFVIPSTREPASISQLEAMAFSLPVICSDTNGTACYVENGINGYHFKDNDKEDLIDKIEMIISDMNLMKKMGKESYMAVREKYCFRNYYESLYNILKVLN